MSADLENTMERIGRILTADSTLRVEIRGDQAFAEPGRVVLPSIDRYEHLGAENAERLLHGLVDHECGHAADSDFDYSQRAHEVDPAFKLLFNAIEDGYVEARRGYLYAGSHYNLGQKNAWFWSTDLDEKQRSVEHRLQDPEHDQWEKFILGLTLALRPDGGVTLEMIEAADARTGMMLRTVWPIVEHIPSLMVESQQSAHCYAATEQIWAIFRPPPPPPPPPGGGGGEPDPDAKPTPKRKGSDPGAPPPPPPTSGGGSEKAREEMCEQGVDPEMVLERYTKNENKGGCLNPEDAITSAMRKVFDDPADTHPYIVFDPSFDLERDFSSEFTDTLSKAYERDFLTASTITDELVSTLESALFAKRERRLSFSGDEEGEIDVPMLAEYAVGAARSEDLWVDYTAEEDGDHAAVALLVDCSGSMGNGMEYGEFSKSYLARLCAIAMHEALKRVQVQHEISGFTTIANEDANTHPWAQNREAAYTEHFAQLRRVCIEAHNRGTDLSKFARTCAGDPNDPGTHLTVPIYGVFKGFDTEESRGLVLIAGLAANLDGEAILWQARRLARRSERRKVLLVLSDGYPAGSHDNAAGAKHLTDAVQRALACGIEVYGIGINSDAVRKFYPHSWVCRNLSELPTILFRALLETVVETGTTPWKEGLL